jgi:cob(I)alamin adenosyltransferase
MSISTKKGDDGTTGLMYNRRVSKDHPRLEAYGTCDELNVAMGLAKAHLLNSKSSFAPWICEQLLTIQKTFILLMGELATLPDDRERYQKNHRFINEGDEQFLTKLVDELESQNISFDGWATPGANLPSAALDQARVTCRRAERKVFALGEEIRALNPNILKYLNRLSDLLWLLARKVETEVN